MNESIKQAWLDQVNDPNYFGHTLDNCFSSTDLDRSGFIEQSELYHILKHFSKRLGIQEPTLEDTKKELTRLDINFDGKWSKDEFAKLVKEFWILRINKISGSSATKEKILTYINNASTEENNSTTCSLKELTTPKKASANNSFCICQNYLTNLNNQDKPTGKSLNYPFMLMNSSFTKPFIRTPSQAQIKVLQEPHSNFFYNKMKSNKIRNKISVMNGTCFPNNSLFISHNKMNWENNEIQMRMRSQVVKNNYITGMFVKEVSLITPKTFKGIKKRKSLYSLLH